MNSIRLRNIRLYANHGCLSEEEKIGSDYLVNLEVKANLDTASVSDDLADTVDYVRLHTIVKEEMAVRSKLLEHVGRRIIERILTELPGVDHVDVEVSKLNPPIGGDVEAVSVSMSAGR